MLALAYAMYFAAFTVARHRAFMTQSFDLSVYIQMLWNSLHGDLLRVTIQEGRLNYLQHHFAPSMLLLIPLYAAWSDPQMLLVLQSIVLASGAWPIYRLANRNHPGSWRGCVFGTIYLLYPALQAANLYDFHEITIAAPLLAWTWYFAQFQKWPAFWLTAVLALGFREEVVIFTTGMGLVLAARQNTRKHGFLLVIVSLAWLCLLLLVSFYQSKYNMNAALYFRNRFDLGSDPLSALKGILSDPGGLFRRLASPEKIFYLFSLFAPAGFFLLFSWEALLLVLPFVGLNLLGSYPLLITPTQAHYNVLLVPVIVITAEIGSDRLVNWKSERSRPPMQVRNFAVCAFILLLSFGYQLRLAHLPLSTYFSWPQVSERHRLAERIAASIPVEASLSIQDNLAPHASQRRDLFIFPHINQAQYIYLDLVVVEDLRRNRVYDLTPQVQAAVDDKRYETVVDQDGLLLLRRKY